MRALRLVVLVSALALVVPARVAVAEDVADPAIYGSVKTASAQPLVGASVRAISGGSVISQVTTAGDGSYRLDIPDGAYTIAVESSDPQLAPVQAPGIDAPRHWPLDFVLTQKTEGRIFLTGDVTLSTGVPVTEGNALFGGAGNRIGRDGYFLTATTPGRPGTWSFITTSRPQPGVVLNLTATNGASATYVQDTYIEATVPMTSTRVVVTDSTGAAVANANVRLNVGGFGMNPGRANLVSGGSSFAVSWTATARTNDAGVVDLPRPVMLAAQTGTLLVDAPIASLRGGSWPVTIGAEAGQHAAVLTPRDLSPTPVVTPTPTPVPTVTPTPTPTPTSSPAPAERIALSGAVTLGNGRPVAGAVVIPIDPTARVNGGNNAGSDGRYVVPTTVGFTGHWSIAGRAQGSLAVPDPLWFALRGGDNRTYTANTTVDFVVPMNYYRVRVVDPQGNPVPNVRLSLSARDESAFGAAQVQILPGQVPFVGTWRGLDTTGPDGWAQVPAVTMVNSPNLNLEMSTDPDSRVESRSLTIGASDLRDVTIALAIKPPAITRVNPLTARPGDRIDVTGSNLIGTQQVTVAGREATFTVVNAGLVRVEVPSDAASGPITVVTGGGSVTSSAALTVLPPPLTIATADLPNGQVGSPYSQTLEATGGTAPYSWSIVGSRPSGLSVTHSGDLIGVPLRALHQNITVAATDASGNRVTRLLRIVIAPKPLTAPGPIAGVRATGSAQRISLQWNAPLDDGGNRVSGYRIEVSTDGGASWGNLIENTRSRTTSRSFPYSAGVPSTFRVSAINASGVGAFGPDAISNEASAFTVPSAPQQVTATGGRGTIAVAWQVPGSDGGASIVGYRIRVSTNGSAWSTLLTNSGSVQTSALIRVSGGRSYFVQVAAINAAGLSSYESTPQATTVAR